MIYKNEILKTYYLMKKPITPPKKLFLSYYYYNHIAQRLFPDKKILLYVIHKLNIIKRINKY